MASEFLIMSYLPKAHVHGKNKKRVVWKWAYIGFFNWNKFLKNNIKIKEIKIPNTGCYRFGMEHTRLDYNLQLE